MDLVFESPRAPVGEIRFGHGPHSPPRRTRSRHEPPAERSLDQLSTTSRDAADDSLVW